MKKKKSLSIQSGCGVLFILPANSFDNPKWPLGQKFETPALLCIILDMLKAMDTYFYIYG